MKKACGKALLILSSFVLALLIMESVVRVLDLPPQPLAPRPITDFRLSENPVMSYEYQPGHKPSERPFDESHRGFAINSAGFRDYEYAETKPAETYRIIVVGDSTTAGNGVPDLDNIYTKQLEKLLNTHHTTGVHYEVLNMGVGGYHTMQEIETLRVKGLPYHPDLVLVTFCVNDFDLHTDGGLHQKLLQQTRLATRNTAHDLYSGLLRLSRLAFIMHHRLKLGPEGPGRFILQAYPKRPNDCASWVCSSLRTATKTWLCDIGSDTSRVQDPLYRVQTYAYS